MRKLFSIVLLLAIASLAACKGLNNSKHSMANGKQVHTLSPVEYRAKMAPITTVLLIDVRTPQEYASGHLKNAINIDYTADDFGTRISRLDKDKAVFVYCRSGRRSSAAANQMREAGFLSLYDLDGGIISWQEEGLPVEQ